MRKLGKKEKRFFPLFHHSTTPLFQPGLSRAAVILVTIIPERAENWNPSPISRLDFQKPFGYERLMELTEEIKISLRREYTLCSNAMAFYEKAIKDFEQKYHSPTDTFLKQFEMGRMGDDADFFDWYAFTKLLEQWQKTQSVLRSALQ